MLRKWYALRNERYASTYGQPFEFPTYGGPIVFPYINEGGNGLTGLGSSTAETLDLDLLRDS